MGFGLDFLGSVAGNLLDAGVSIFNNERNVSSNKSMQNSNISWEREQHQNRIQWAANDASAAGIHPLAAIGQAGNISSAPAGVSTGGVNSNFGSIAGSYADRKLRERQQRLAEMQQVSGVGVNESQAAKNIAEAKQNESMSRYYDVLALQASGQSDIMTNTGTYPGQPMESWSLGWGLFNRSRPAGTPTLRLNSQSDVPLRGLRGII